MAKNKMPKAKVGKVYPITYFSNYDETFKASNGIFEFRNWQFERIARNKIKVVKISGD